VEDVGGAGSVADLLLGSDGRTPTQVSKGKKEKIAMSAEWYVLQTKPRKEQFVVGQLNCRRAQVFYPRLMESVRIGEARQQRLAPMFPSYMFVKLDVDESGKGVRYTPGVKDFLRCDGSRSLFRPMWSPACRSAPDLPESTVRRSRISRPARGCGSKKGRCAEWT